MKVNKTFIKVIVHLPAQCLYTVISWEKHLESDTGQIFWLSGDTAHSSFSIRTIKLVICLGCIQIQGQMYCTFTTHFLLLSWISTCFTLINLLQETVSFL